ncbi:YoaK family protein [Paracoccus aerius]
MARRTRFLRPLTSAKVLVSHRRSRGSDHVLALFLAGIAGASNAGGFFALGQYTSHMTGYLSQIADSLAVGNLLVTGTALLAIGAFTAGAAFCAFLVHWARHRMGRQQFALPLAVQGFCLGCFAFGGIFTTTSGRLFALACLCFIMGMQNATITKISGARIRTTHATGMITDIGIEEVGRYTGWFNRDAEPARTCGNCASCCRSSEPMCWAGSLGPWGMQWLVSISRCRWRFCCWRLRRPAFRRGR